MSEKRTYTMRVIQEPAPNTRSVMLLLGHKGAWITSEGPLSYTCGGCGNTLLKDIDRNQVQNIVIKCGVCAAFNEMPASSHGH